MPLVIPSEGGCQCGEIRYRLIGEPIFLGVCHCTDCKHQSGSAFGMSLRMRKADVELLQGAPKQWTTRSDNGNPKICVFCGTCGTRLWNGPGPLGNLSVKPGTLDDPSQLAPRYEGYHWACGCPVSGARDCRTVREVGTKAGADALTVKDRYSNLSPARETGRGFSFGEFGSGERRG